MSEDTNAPAQASAHPTQATWRSPVARIADEALRLQMVADDAACAADTSEADRFYAAGQAATAAKVQEFIAKTFSIHPVPPLPDAVAQHMAEHVGEPAKAAAPEAWAAPVIDMRWFDHNGQVKLQFRRGTGWIDVPVVVG